MLALNVRSRVGGRQCAESAECCMKTMRWLREVIQAAAAKSSRSMRGTGAICPPLTQGLISFKSRLMVRIAATRTSRSTVPFKSKGEVERNKKPCAPAATAFMTCKRNCIGSIVSTCAPAGSTMDCACRICSCQPGIGSVEIDTQLVPALRVFCKLPRNHSSFFLRSACRQL